MLQHVSHAKMLVALIGVLVIGGGAYAFTASNTVPGTTAGSGSGAVSGYTVTNVHYTLNATTPGNIDAVSFTIAPAVPNTGSGRVVMQAALSTGGPNTYPCTTDVPGTTATCVTTSTQLTSALLTGVTVVAAQ